MKIPSPAEICGKTKATWDKAVWFFTPEKHVVTGCVHWPDEMPANPFASLQLALDQANALKMQGFDIGHRYEKDYETESGKTTWYKQVQHLNSPFVNWWIDLLLDLIDKLPGFLKGERADRG